MGGMEIIIFYTISKYIKYIQSQNISNLEKDLNIYKYYKLWKFNIISCVCRVLIYILKKKIVENAWMNINNN